jgi:hypothetical protein
MLQSSLLCLLGVVTAFPPLLADGSGFAALVPVAAFSVVPEFVAPELAVVPEVVCLRGSRRTSFSSSGIS